MMTKHIARQTDFHCAHKNQVFISTTDILCWQQFRTQNVNVCLGAGYERRTRNDFFVSYGSGAVGLVWVVDRSLSEANLIVKVLGMNGN